MKKISALLLSLILLSFCFQSCDNYKTYAEKLKDEKEAIDHFKSQENINVISLNTFLANDTITDLERNEYVFFSDKGVYMQVVNETKAPDARLAKDNDQILVRFTQTGIMNSNQDFSSMDYPLSVDEFRLSSLKTLTASFVSESIMEIGPMYDTYGSSVPIGWVIPLEFIKLSRSSSDKTYIKLIVPSKMGTSNANTNVYPYYYELTYQFSQFN